MRSRIVEPTKTGAQEALLGYHVLARRRGQTLVEVIPHTGRHHQIRLQLGDYGYPVVGDLKYGASEPLADKTIALHAVALEVKHPTRDEVVRLASSPPPAHPWRPFLPTIEARYR